MIRTLLIITGAGLLLCIVAGAGALAIGGQDLARHGWAWTIDDNDGDHVRFERVYNEEREPRVTRTLAWTGGDRLQVDVPGDVVYVQGAEAGVTVEGPKSVADRVRVVDGRLTIIDKVETEHSRGGRSGSFSWTINNRTFASSDGLRVTVTAPSVKTFDIRGSSDVSIRAYDQPTLAIDVAGSSSVDIAGRAAAMDLDISGSGDIDAEAVEVRDAVIDISGSGDVRVGPTQMASVDISGSGDVTLTRRPARLNQDISGSGDVDVQ